MRFETNNISFSGISDTGFLKKIILLSIIIFSVLKSNSQNNLVFIPQTQLPKFVKYENRINDIGNGRLQCQKIVFQLATNGYITADIDSTYTSNDTFFAKFYIGKIYNWGNVNTKNLPENFIKKFGFDKIADGTANLNQLKKSMNEVIDFYENKGYPFAYFSWDSLKIDEDTISGNLNFEKNYYITFDTIALYGDNILSKKFLYNYLEIKPGMAYEEKKFNQIKSKIDKLPFASLQRKPQIFFVERKAVILLVLKKRSVNRLDGIAGFAPSTDTKQSNKLLLTGEFHIDLKNIKGSGMALKTDWQSFKERSQSFALGFDVPYLLNSPVGAGFKVELLKYDTIYTETKFGLNLNYYFSGNDFLSVFYENQSTNLLKADTVQIRKTGKIGSFTPMNNFSYGVMLSKNSIGNILNPKNGYSARLKFSFTKRKIKTDNNISNVKFWDAKTSTFYTVYDSLKTEIFQIKIDYNFVKIFPLIKNTVLYTELKGANTISPDIYYNELYRFGGFATLRGFNEQSLFASSYSIFNLEMRYLLSENSFVRLFGNAAYYIDKSNRQNKIAEDFPIGYGAGINLETGAGILNLSVAQGKSKYNPAEFRNTKIHIGLINYF